MSRFIGLGCGIRQGGVLSPYFFAFYIDNVIKKVNDSKVGCYIKYKKIHSIGRLMPYLVKLVSMHLKK